MASAAAAKLTQAVQQLMMDRSEELSPERAKEAAQARAVDAGDQAESKAERGAATPRGEKALAAYRATAAAEDSEHATALAAA